MGASEGESHGPRGIGGWHGRGPNVDRNEFGDSDETADAGNLTESDIGLIVRNAHSDDCMMFGDGGANGGNDNDLNDDENVVGSESGFSVCEDGSGDCVRLGICNG